MFRRLLATVLIAFLAIPAVATPLERPHVTMVEMAHSGHDHPTKHEQAPGLPNHVCIGCVASYGQASVPPEPMIPLMALPPAQHVAALVPHFITPETPPPRA
jgi:hypothetical protein